MSVAVGCDLECRSLVLQPHRSTSATRFEFNATLSLAMYLVAWQKHFFLMHGIEFKRWRTIKMQNDKQFCHQRATTTIITVVTTT